MYQEYSPCNILAPFIDKYWIFKGDPEYGTRFNILPDGCTDFIFSLGEVANPTDTSQPVMQPYLTFFVGPMRTYSELITRTASVHMIGVRFLACGLASFTALPLHEFTDQRINLTDLCLLFDTDLSEQLREKNNIQEHIQLIEEFLIKRLYQYRQVDKQVLLTTRLINNFHGRLPVNKLLDDVCICQRHLERKFKYATGFSPKEYSRIIKFQHAVANLRKATNARTLFSIAIDCGYYDQAHFSKEIKRLSGNTASTFLSLPIPEGEPLTYL